MKTDEDIETLGMLPKYQLDHLQNSRKDPVIQWIPVATKNNQGLLAAHSGAGHVCSTRGEHDTWSLKGCEGWVKVGEGYVGWIYDFHRLMHSENKQMLNLGMEIPNW